MSVPFKPRPIRLTSAYEARCARCGEVIESPAVEGVCGCGKAYKFEWQAPYTSKPGPPPPSLDNQENGTC
jgi:hypothetical protein